MFYDPMISKLITWGEDRERAMRILDRAFDEYVIQGVTHNIGFGKSILANNSFWTGDYSTAFIPDFYPDGFSGDKLEVADYETLAIVAHRIKNLQLAEGGSDESATTLYMCFDDGEDDFRVHAEGDNMSVTNLTTGATKEVNLSSFSFTHNALIKLQ